MNTKRKRVDLTKVTLFVRSDLKDRADALAERHGDLTRMFERGLELVVIEEEKKRAEKQADRLAVLSAAS